MIYIDEHINNFDLEAGLALLSDQRREQALKFKFEQGRRTCVLAYLLLMRGLRQEFGIEEKPLFEYGEHGKPRIVGHPEVQFNLSHCREAVACAIGREPVGIDVESVREYKETLVNYTMNAEEATLISASERPAVAFTRLWTQKEALLKLTGEGISRDLKTVLSQADGVNFTTEERLDKHYVYTICKYDGKKDC